MATRYNWLADTGEEAFRVLTELNRKLTPGEKIARALDVERKRRPVVFTIDDGQEPKGFKNMIEEIAKKDKELEKKR